MPAEETFRAVLGERKYQDMIDAVVAKRLLPELYAQGKKYSDVRGEFQAGRFTVEEEPMYIAPGFRAGKLHFTLNKQDGDEEFSMFSFYRLAFSDVREKDVRRDYALMNYLQTQRGVVPQVVFYDGRLAVTEMIAGKELSVFRREKSFGDTRKRDPKNYTDCFELEGLGAIVDEMFRYHDLANEKNTGWNSAKGVRRVLEQKPLEAYYSVEKFLNDINAQRRVAQGYLEYFVDQWSAVVDEPLQRQRQGLLHNDLHVGNIFMTPNGARLIDWGDATIGPIVYDLCRLLMSTGFFGYIREKRMENFWKGLDVRKNKLPGLQHSDSDISSLAHDLRQKAANGGLFGNSWIREEAFWAYVITADDKRDLKEISPYELVPFEVAKILCWQSNAGVNAMYDLHSLGDAFYQDFSRAHASIRLRLAGAGYKTLQRLRIDEAYQALLANEEKEFLEGLASYHLTACHLALKNDLNPRENYALPERHGLKDSTSTPQLGIDLWALLNSMNDPSLRLYSGDTIWMETFERKYNPDIDGMKLLRQIQLKMGFVDREREVQNKDIAEMARRRKGFLG